MGTWRVLVESVLEALKLFVFVVAVDCDFLDQEVEIGIGLAGRAHSGCLLVAR
jgi:hypothetical protein